MFNNIRELITNINEGKSNEEIIFDRIEYLKSQQYKDTRIKDIKEQEKLCLISEIANVDIKTSESNVVIFKDGFIDEDYSVSHRSGYIDWSNGYNMDDYSIYYQLLDYIRENIGSIEKNGGIKIREICSILREYFRLSEDSPYYNTVIYLKQWYENNKTFKLQQQTSDLFVRYELPEIINSYKASNFNGNIEEYTKLYIEHNFDHRYGLKDGEDEFLKINFDESKLFEPTKISEIKNTGAVACTEYSMVLQNVLSFLGYDTYMIGGTINGGGHNYNVVKDKSGRYRVIDIAQLVYGEEMENINAPQELTNFGERIIKNRRGEQLLYSSEFEKNQNDDGAR